MEKPISLFSANKLISSELNTLQNSLLISILIFEIMLDELSISTLEPLLAQKNESPCCLTISHR